MYPKQILKSGEVVMGYFWSNLAEDAGGLVNPHLGLPAALDGQDTLVTSLGRVRGFMEYHPAQTPETTPENSSSAFVAESVTRVSLTHQTVSFVSPRLQPLFFSRPLKFISMSFCSSFQLGQPPPHLQIWKRRLASCSQTPPRQSGFETGGLA